MIRSLDGFEIEAIEREKRWAKAWKSKLFVAIVTANETWRKRLNDCQWDFNIRKITLAQIESEQWLTSNGFKKVVHYGLEKPKQD
jgi:hypothetical protein